VGFVEWRTGASLCWTRAIEQVASRQSARGETLERSSSLLCRARHTALNSLSTFQRRCSAAARTPACAQGFDLVLHQGDQKR